MSSYSHASTCFPWPSTSDRCFFILTMKYFDSYLLIYASINNCISHGVRKRVTRSKTPSLRVAYCSVLLQCLVEELGFWTRETREEWLGREKMKELDYEVRGIYYWKLHFNDTWSVKMHRFLFCLLSNEKLRWVRYSLWAYLMNLINFGFSLGWSEYHTLSFERVVSSS